MSMLDEIWTCGLSYKDRPVKSGSALERTLCLYAYAAAGDRLDRRN